MGIERIKLNLAQAKAIESIRKEHDGNVDAAINFHALTKYQSFNNYYVFEQEAAQSLSIPQFSRAFQVGYEVIIPDQTITVTKELRSKLKEVYAGAKEKEVHLAYRTGFAAALKVMGVESIGIVEGEDL